MTSGGVQYDNSPSRLNVAKAGIAAILNNFMEYADFALMDYSTTYEIAAAPILYDLGLLHERPGRLHLHTLTPGASEYVANPCYNVPLNAATSVR